MSAIKVQHASYSRVATATQIDSAAHFLANNLINQLLIYYQYYPQLRISRNQWRVQRLQRRAAGNIAERPLPFENVCTIFQLSELHLALAFRFGPLTLCLQFALEITRRFGWAYGPLLAGDAIKHVLLHATSLKTKLKQNQKYLHLIRGPLLVDDSERCWCRNALRFGDRQSFQLLLQRACLVLRSYTR